MQLNYAHNLDLFERCINLIDSVFPGCKQMAVKGIHYNACWYEASTPFVIEENGEIIAHVGVWPITLMVNGKVHHTASIHGVCVKPEQRGKGYYKQLMREAMGYAEQNCESSLLFTDKPYLYKDLPYTAMLPEYDFIVKQKYHGAVNSDIRVMNLDDPTDLSIVQNIIKQRLPLTNQMSIVTANALYIPNMLSKKIYYSEKLKALLSYEVQRNTLYLADVVTTQPCSFNDIIAVIPENYAKIILQFCPDGLLHEQDYTPVMAAPECCVMVSETFPFAGKFFRYPQTYCC